MTPTEARPERLGWDRQRASAGAVARDLYTRAIEE
jgi:hypothetical protein